MTIRAIMAPHHLKLHNRFDVLKEGEDINKEMINNLISLDSVGEMLRPFSRGHRSISGSIHNGWDKIVNISVLKEDLARSLSSNHRESLNLDFYIFKLSSDPFIEAAEMTRKQKRTFELDYPQRVHFGVEKDGENFRVINVSSLKHTSAPLFTRKIRLAPGEEKKQYISRFTETEERIRPVSGTKCTRDEFGVADSKAFSPHASRAEQMKALGVDWDLENQRQAKMIITGLPEGCNTKVKQKWVNGNLEIDFIRPDPFAGHYPPGLVRHSMAIHMANESTDSCISTMSELCVGSKKNTMKFPAPGAFKSRVKHPEE